MINGLSNSISCSTRKDKYVEVFDSRYEKKIVCFYDILGTKKLLEKESVDKVKQLIGELLEVKGYDSFDKVKRVVLSDSVYLYCNVEDVISLLDYIAVLSYRLLFSDNAPVSIDISKDSIEPTRETYNPLGLLARGGIVFGDVLINEQIENSILFGPAVSMAYSLESDVSIYPRVVFDEEIRNIVIKHSIQNVEETVVCSEIEGYYFFDWIKYFKMIRRQQINCFQYDTVNHMLCKEAEGNNLHVSVKYKWFLKNLWKSNGFIGRG